jgi:hypothetical protein
MMRLSLAAALLAAVPAIVHAQAIPGGYIEGAIGISLISDVETEDYLIDVPGYGTFFGRAEANYETEFTGGAEIGLTTGRWRFGASWDFTSAQLDTARVIGELDGSPISQEITDDALAEDFGISLDNNAHLFAGNAYYNFGPADASFRPYIGVGLGAAVFEKASTEFAVTATLGARFALGPRTYVGTRYRLTHIGGPTDDFGAEYEPITLHTFSLLLGLYFGG